MCIKSEENVIESNIILSKTLYFFIWRQLKIIKCFPNFVMSKKTRYLVWFLTDGVGQIA